MSDWSMCTHGRVIKGLLMGRSLLLYGACCLGKRTRVEKSDRREGQRQGGGEGTEWYRKEGKSGRMKVDEMKREGGKKGREEG